MIAQHDNTRGVTVRDAVAKASTDIDAVLPLVDAGLVTFPNLDCVHLESLRPGSIKKEWRVSLTPIGMRLISP